MKRIVVLLTIWSVCFVSGATAFWKGAPTNRFNAGGVQINRSPHAYYTGANRWIDWWQQGFQPVINSSLNGQLIGKAAWDAVGASGQPYFNSATGELTVPVQSDVTSYGRGLFTAPDSVNGAAIPNAIYGQPGASPVGPQGKWWLGAVFNLEWTGTISTAGTKFTTSGSFGTGGSPGFGTLGDCGTNCISVTLGNSVAAVNLAIFFVVDASNSSDPPRQIKFYPSQYATQAHSADLATRLINPDWLAQYGTFGKSGVGVIRWMTENGETNVFGATDFSQLAEYTFNSFGQTSSSLTSSSTNQTYPAGYNGTYGPKGGIGPQTVCVVQNKVGAHAAYPLPFGANSSFATSVALAFDGCMNQGEEVWYSDCNEVWNFGASFRCFYFLSSQAWPPLGASAPYQQAVAISSITAGATTVVNTATPHGFSNGSAIGLNLSTSDTMSTVLNNNSFNVSGVTSTSFTISAITTGLSYSSGGTTYTAGAATTRGGYNAAVQMNYIRSAYGTSKRARWKGLLEGQIGNISVAQAALTGAIFFINNESVGSGPCAPNLCFTDLFDKGMIAPYSGNSSYNGTAIQNITQNTAAGSTVVTAAGHSFTNGEKIRIYAKSGMTQIDNATATVSSASSGSFNIDVNTTGYSAWVSHADSGSAGNGNFAIDNALPQAADDSITKNISNPATYPTKYSYFAEQMTDAILNGTSVSNPSFGYTVSSSGNYRSFASCGSACLPGLLLSHALLFKSYGLTIDEYEAAPFSTYVDTASGNGSTNITTTGAGSGACAPDLCSGRLWDFFENWQYDAGTATHGPADISTAHIQAGIDAGVSYPSIFVEQGPNPGPFALTRYFGDTPPTTAPLYAKNAAGPYIEPKPAPSWTLNYAGNTTNRQFFSGACSSCTDTLSGLNLGTGSSQVFVLATGGGSGSPTITCDTQGGGGQVVLTPVSSGNVGSSNLATVFSGALASNASAIRSCTAAYSGTGQTFQQREYYAFVVTGLKSTSPTFTTSGANTSGTTVAIDSDSIVIMSACRPAYVGIMSGSDTPTAANPATKTVASDLDNVSHIAGFTIFNPSFKSPIASINAAGNQAGGMAVAVYH